MPKICSKHVGELKIFFVLDPTLNFKHFIKGSVAAEQKLTFPRICKNCLPLLVCIAHQQTSKYLKILEIIFDSVELNVKLGSFYRVFLKLNAPK